LAVAKAIVGKKIPRPHGRAGSIPALGTIYNKKAALVAAFLLSVINTLQYYLVVSFSYVTNRTGDAV